MIPSSFVLIRKMEEKDHERVAELMNTCFPYMRATKKLIETRVESGFHFFVAEIDGEVVGFLDLEEMRHSVKVWGLCVAPKFRNRGVGRALMKKAEEFAKEIGKEGLWLYTKDEKVGFYEKLGFVRLGKLGDRVIMVKPFI